MAGSPNTFTVKPALGVNTVKEFIALAKTDPPEFNVATPPVGTTPQLQAELLKLRERLAGHGSHRFRRRRGSVKSPSQRHRTAELRRFASRASHIKAGYHQMSGRDRKTRWPDLPDVPTMEEQGFKDFVFATDTALLAPASTPSEIVRRIEKETLGVLARPDIREKLLTAGFQVHATDGKTCLERLVKEMTMFRDIIIQAGIQKL